MTQRLNSMRYSGNLRRFSGHARHFITKLGCKQNEQLHFILVHDDKNKNKRYRPAFNHPAMTLHKRLSLLERRTPQFTLFTKRNKRIHVFSQNKKGQYHLLALRTKQRVTKLKNAFIKKFQVQIKDTMIIETKNGYHIYWVVQGGAISKFVPIQKALAKKFNSDPLITNLSRVMRIPGFYHMKNPRSPFIVKVRQLGRNKPFSQEEIIQSLALKPFN
ncbi:DNA-primase RepB domain-containing protein [Paenibacillus algorifonticola]|uniref:DNA-primase RepB domain-containing protein n=1 Tax=Paenibacillus algorifonticola TaxID=684063 RepID=UPI003D286239